MAANGLAGLIMLRRVLPEPIAVIKGLIIPVGETSGLAVQYINLLSCGQFSFGQK